MRVYIILQSCKQKKVITSSRKKQGASAGSEEIEDSRFSKTLTQSTLLQASKPHSFSIKALTLVKQICQVDKPIFSGTLLHLNHIPGLILSLHALRAPGFLILP